ncbi:MAG: hypothetical protein K1X95_12600, partial [Acidimicrobiia bacterium]|nr:hypothetical protein [Acidimicrobiia bacterium]
MRDSDSGAAALAALVVVLCGTLAALGCVDIALLGAARARAGAAADASALAAALVVDSGAGAVGQAAGELARRNGAERAASAAIEAARSEV